MTQNADTPHASSSHSTKTRIQRTRLLLGSGGLSTPQRQQDWAREFDDFLGSIQNVLLIPWAGHDPDQYLQMLSQRINTGGRTLDSIHLHPDPVATILRAEALLVGGGNTFRLLQRMHHHAVLDAIQDRVRKGMPYMGISAGTNVACPTIMTTNDMPIVMPPTLQALGLVPFQINAHYYSGPTMIRLADESVIPYGGETRDDRLNEYHQMNERPVLAMWEGGILRVEHGSALLKGHSTARLFTKGEPAQDLPADADVSHLLRPAHA
ncbi:MAG: dipeptidase PepE [Planctomycetota bacterium]